MLSLQTERTHRVLLSDTEIKPRRGKFMTFDEQRESRGMYARKEAAKPGPGWLIYIHVEDPVKRSCYVQGIPT